LTDSLSHNRSMARIQNNNNDTIPDNQSNQIIVFTTVNLASLGPLQKAGRAEPAEVEAIETAQLRVTS
ncbi:MAG: hypothetical protein AAF639_05085, partial [Chloroflexota bacterium]